MDIIHELNDQLQLKSLLINCKYSVKQSYYINNELIVNNYGIGIYLGSYLNDNRIELLFYFNNEEVEDTTFTSSYMIDLNDQEYMTVYRFYEINDLEIIAV